MRPWLIAVVILLADQWTKALVIASFLPGQSMPLLPPLVSLTYVQNTGAAFGLFKGQQTLFIVLSVLIIGWVAAELSTPPPKPLVGGWSYALILGGAAGNLIDRARWGYVVDFIDLHVRPVFNVSDSAITIGVTLLVLHTLRPKQQATSNKQQVR